VQPAQHTVVAPLATPERELSHIICIGNVSNICSDSAFNYAMMEVLAEHTEAPESIKRLDKFKYIPAIPVMNTRA